MLSEKWSEDEQAKRDAFARNIDAYARSIADPQQARIVTPAAPRVVAMIQARMGSTRLPGKVLRPIHGRPVIGRIFDRLCYAKSLDSIVVATSVNPENDPIEAFCTREGIGCFRGPEKELDQRLLQAAEATSAAAIVRITADCPLVDPGIVDECVDLWRGPGFGAQPRFDYVSNVYPVRHYPDGLDVEVISTECLRFLVAQDRFGWDHEALTTNIWHHPLWFRIGYIKNPQEGNLGHLRWTLDKPEDWPVIIDAWGTLPEAFTWRDVLAMPWDRSIPHPDRKWFRPEPQGGSPETAAQNG